MFLATAKDVDRTKQAIQCLRLQHAVVERHVTFSFVFPLDAQQESAWRFWNDSCDSISNALHDYEARSRPARLARTEVPYPMNLMRNVGRKSSRTHFFAVHDADVTPSLGLRTGFTQMVKTAGLLGREDAIYIMPAFELKTGMAFPRNKSELRSLSDVGFARQLFGTWCSYAHVSVQSLWQSLSNVYFFPQYTVYQKIL